MRLHSARALFFCCTCALIGQGATLALAAAEPITEIRFVGNETTKPEILLQEMTLAVGDPADPEEIARSRQAIMDLGIFQDVNARVLPATEGVVLEMEIKEKHYFLPIPRLNRNAEGDISYGAQLRFDNLFGLNQQLKLTYEQTKPSGTNVSAVDEVEGSYAYPRVLGTAYSVALSGRAADHAVDAADEGFPGLQYTRHEHSVGVAVSRLLAEHGPTRGWGVSTGLGWNRTEFDFDAGLPQLIASQNLIGWSAGADYYDVRDYLYSRSGKAYGAAVELGVPTLGSDFYYERYSLYLRRYNLITDRPHYSLDYQVQLGVSTGFPDPVYQLGGASSLRGYPRDGVEGNAFVLANIEYLQPLFGHRALRGVVFLDVGNAYPTANEIDLFDLEASVGVGLRYVLKSFVDIQLRVDFGYAIKTGENKTYGGTKDTF